MTWSMGIAVILHSLSAMIWVGGMFFAYQVLRPVIAQQLEPPARLTVWRQVFRQFFWWVWPSLAVLWVSGAWMIYAKGGFAQVGWHVHAMLSVGLLMTLVFIYLQLIPYKQLIQAVDNQHWSDGGKALARIRTLVATNLILGLITISIGAGGQYMIF